MSSPFEAKSVLVAEELVASSEPLVGPITVIGASR